MRTPPTSSPATGSGRSPAKAIATLLATLMALSLLSPASAGARLQECVLVEIPEGATYVPAKRVGLGAGSILLTGPLTTSSPLYLDC
ncbi:MAG: hypothetical protein ABW001_00090 [Mycobacterium sp.]